MRCIGNIVILCGRHFNVIIALQYISGMTSGIVLQSNTIAKIVFKIRDYCVLQPKST